MTWGECKIITLKKMFTNERIISENEITELQKNDEYKLFLDNMPFTANEGINRIYQNGRPKYVLEDGEYVKNIPEKIESNTSNDYELPLTEEEACILPLYIASEIYKDDDLTLSTVYRNEFETALLELKQNLENENEVNIIYTMN